MRLSRSSSNASFGPGRLRSRLVAVAAGFCALCVLRGCLQAFAFATAAFALRFMLLILLALHMAFYKPAILYTCTHMYVCMYICYFPLPTLSLSRTSKKAICFVPLRNVPCKGVISGDMISTEGTRLRNLIKTRVFIFSPNPGIGSFELQSLTEQVICPFFPPFSSHH